MPINVVVFELDDTLWGNSLDERKYGRGPTAVPKIQDNLELAAYNLVQDRSDPRNYVVLFPDVPAIIHDILHRGLKFGIVSDNTSKALCDRAMYLFQAPNANKEMKPISSLISYDEVGKGSKLSALTRIKEWSGVSYDEILFFDNDHASKEVQEKLGVKFERVSRSRGIQWESYCHAMGFSSPGKPVQSDPHDTPFHGRPHLGKALGSGKFATVHDSPDDSRIVVKVLKKWSKELRHRFLDIYAVVKKGKPFIPGNDGDDQYLLMIAFELRNLAMVNQLIAPKPENFSGWFTMNKVQGIPIWRAPLYQKYPFSVPFQRLVKAAFHLAVDEIEYTVRKYGIEHRDAHVANVYYTMKGDQPVRAYLLDWGIAVKMSWDGSRYVRGEDHLLWRNSGQGEKYTPEEFRRYWITWMVKTKYESSMSKGVITEKDGKEFLKDMEWWYQR